MKFKNLFQRIFIDGLGGMGLGLFATLIIGTIIQQVGTLIGGTVGSTLFLLGKIAAAMTGAGIGVGVAYKFKESPLVVVSAATAGMVGAFAGNIAKGTVFVDGVIHFAGPGEPLGAFIAAYVGIELGHLISGKTSVDILLTPFVSIVGGSAVGLFAGPPISAFMTWLGSDQLGHRAAPLFDGDHRFRIDGNHSYSADQLRGSGHRSEPLGYRRRRGNRRMLCQYDWFCSSQLPRE